MGKTHKALERAEREFGEHSQRDPLPIAPNKPRSSSLLTVESQALLREYEELKANFLTRYSDGSVRTILFTGMRPGGGVTTTAFNFATILARDSDRKVLLIDSNLRTPPPEYVFKANHDFNLVSILRNNNEAYPIEINRGGLQVLPAGGMPAEPLTFFQSQAFKQFLDTMRERFDFVVLDAPPVHSFSECLLLSKMVDGVVLVLQSERVRRRIASRAKQQIESAGGRIIGVVLNRTKHYIPEWLYRRL
jgi:capsular exopolysaccharide synthesis family protein